MRKDSLTIMPRNRDIELSYRMKYYEVDNEKLFGDIIVTQQTIGRIYVHENCHVPTIYMQKRQNLKREIHEWPDFMTLNTRKLKRYSKTENEAKFYAIQYKEDSFHENKEQASVQRRNYPLPMVREMSQEGAISSLVDQLLLDIYGFPRGDRSRSESESTVSSLRPRPQHRYLRKARLQLKSTEELTIVLETLHSHVNHAGGLLIRQLRRRDYLRTKRDRQYDVITAHLQAYSNKRSMSLNKKEVKLFS